MPWAAAISDGGWARVTDRSFRGVALDAGLVISPFCSTGPSRSSTGPSFLLGAGFLPGGGYVDAEVGFCWWF